ncbi:MAG: FeoB-associated Cys-rich membrane protein [Clostridia bacterium]|nr:FeoB-associated Cys-rich membrane protein [Clostridia bacterium]
MNAISIVLAAVLALCVITAILWMVKRKPKGCSGCCEGCRGCKK